MSDLPPRLERERRTMAAMIRIYCEGNHGRIEAPCAECQDLLTFAEFRLRRCPHQEDKPTCTSCPVHCYKPDRREQIRRVMRYAGPRMMFRHPIFALRHWLDGFKKAPPSRASARARGDAAGGST